MIAAKELLPLNPESFPGCVLSRSNPSDVARVEHLTFVCTRQQGGRGPEQHWIAPAQAHAQMDALFAGCMKGRTLYVVPYCMGPDRLAVLPVRRRDHRQRLRGAQHAAHDAHGPRGARAHRARRQVREGTAFHRRSRTRSAASSCISPKSSPSRVSAPATAAMPCSARNATRCASPAGRHAPKAGWPSTCSSSASRIRRARFIIWPAPSPPPAARPTWPC